MARALVIGESAKKKAARLVEFASRPENIYNPGPDARVPGDDPHYVLNINFGFRCVFTHTRGPEGGLYRHLSVSVNGPSFPDGFCVLAIAELFGFTSEGDTEHRRAVSINDRDHCVVVVQQIEEEARELDEIAS